MTFRDCANLAVSMAVDLLGEEVDYTVLATGAVSRFFVNRHGTDFKLQSRLELPETSILISIAKANIESPQVGDTMAATVSGETYEIDGVVFETNSLTRVTVRGSSEWV